MENVHQLDVAGLLEEYHDHATRATALLTLSGKPCAGCSPTATIGTTMGSQYDDEKAASVDDKALTNDPITTPTQISWMKKTTNFLAHWGIETNGSVPLLVYSTAYELADTRRCLCSISPILPEDRNDTKLYQMFFVWFSANINILA